MTARSGMQNPKHRILDAELILKDAGLVAASGAATVAGAARVIDVGGQVPTDADPPEVFGDVVIDTTAVEIASNNEAYDITLQGSDVANFTTGSPKIVELATIRLSALEVARGNQDDPDAGRYIMPFYNERNGVRYRYLRLYVTVAGSVATGINFSAYISRAL